MPRELVHWEILLRAAGRAKEEGATIVADIINEFWELALIGAVAHDAPYYYRGGGTRFQKVANGLHGLSGQDTFHPLGLMAKEIINADNIEFRRRCWAFLLGMMSHALADQWFHPWIFYFTGDYYHPKSSERLEARRRHRLLEVYLDAWAANLSDKKAPKVTLLALLKSQRGAPLDSATALMGSILTRNLFFPEVPKKDTTEEWQTALWHQAYLQRAFTSPITGALFDALARIGGNKAKAVEALSSYRRAPVGALLEGQYEYRNPATGEEKSSTLAGLLDSAVDECGRLFIALDAEMNTRSFPAILRLYRGVSLNYGAWGVGPGEAKFYSAAGLALPGLSYS